MITIQTIRTALTAADPYVQIDQLIRAELLAGRKVIEVFDEIDPLVGEVLDTEGLTEVGEDAFLGALDALTGGCHPDSNYSDTPAAARQALNGMPHSQTAPVSLVIPSTNSPD